MIRFELDLGWCIETSSYNCIIQCPVMLQKTGVWVWGDTYRVNPREMTSVSWMSRSDLRARLVRARLLITKLSSWTAWAWTCCCIVALCHRWTPWRRHKTHTAHTHSQNRPRPSSWQEHQTVSRMANSPTSIETALWEKTDKLVKLTEFPQKHFMVGVSMCVCVPYWWCGEVAGCRQGGGGTGAGSTCGAKREGTGV